MAAGRKLRRPCSRAPPPQLGKRAVASGGERQPAEEAPPLPPCRHGSCLDPDAVHVVSRTSTDGGRSWGEVRVVGGNESVRLGNPTAVALASGRLVGWSEEDGALCARFLKSKSP